MKNISRRNFFSEIRGTVVDRWLGNENSPKRKSTPSREFRLGHLSEFPPGTQRRFSCRGGWLTIYSLEGGLKSEWERDDLRFPLQLKIQSSGELSAILDQVCSSRTVLSLMSGEMTELE